MSISNRHSVNPFIAGKSEAMVDQRLAKIGYKSTVKNPAKYPSVCVSVPMVQEHFSEQQIEALVPHIRMMIENAQDGIIRSLYESSDGTLKEVPDTDITVEACLAFLNAESEGGRLTKQFLEQWFDTQLKDNLFVVIADKLKFTDITLAVEETVGKHIAGYRGLFSALAGGKTFLQPVQINGLLKALEVSSVDDDTSGKIRTRLENMLNRPKIEELLEL